jgi:cell division ATPase MinD
MRAIGIVSGKGGVGKTTLAINIAAALAKHYNKRTALVDCNLTTSHVSLYLGIYHKPTTLNHVLRDERSMEEATHFHESGMKVIPASLSLSELDGVDIFNVKERIAKLKEQNDFVILDSAPGLGRESMGTLKAVDEVLFVTTPNILAITDVIRTNEVCQELGVKNLGIVLNMVHKDKYEISRKDVEHITGMPVIASIPYHKNIRKSLAAKKPLVLLHPKDKISREIMNISALIAKEPVIKNTKLLDRLTFWR